MRKISADYIYAMDRSPIKDGVVIGNYEDAVKTKKIMRCAFEIR